MRAYHTGIDYWTVLDDDRNCEYEVAPPDKDGIRKITSRTPPSAHIKPKILAAVEQRRREILID